MGKVTGYLDGAPGSLRSQHGRINQPAFWAMISGDRSPTSSIINKITGNICNIMLIDK
jgi:hypothetical protein